MDLRLLPMMNTASMSPAQTAALRAAQKALAAKTAVGAGQPVGVEATATRGFGDALRTALREVSTAQNRASELQTQLQLGNRNVSLEETMVAMQKAQIGFQAALHVRNRMMQAYTDVMNMQV